MLRGIYRVQVKDLEQALATAQAEHMDYDFAQLQLQESENAHAQQQKVLHVYEPSRIFQDSRHGQTARVHTDVIISNKPRCALPVVSNAQSKYIPGFPGTWCTVKIDAAAGDC